MLFATMTQIVHGTAVGSTFLNKWQRHCSQSNILPSGRPDIALIIRSQIGENGLHFGDVLAPIWLRIMGSILGTSGCKMCTGQPWEAHSCGIGNGTAARAIFCPPGVQGWRSKVQERHSSARLEVQGARTTQWCKVGGPRCKNDSGPRCITHTHTHTQYVCEFF